jgi:hypothetical protein
MLLAAQVASKSVGAYFGVSTGKFTVKPGMDFPQHPAHTAAG